LAQAFVAGLGMGDVPLLPHMTPELMERIGRLLREATQGTLDLLRARAIAKREVRAELTMIVSRDNNPLKFSPSVEVALMHLLAPHGKGFLPPVDAMRDAYDDLRSHELGFMAGLRAALAGVLARFDPAMLEKRLSERSMLDTLLPMNRRVKLWDLYTELYRDIASEAEDDFHALFGREFLRAYEEQVKRLGQPDD
jgi:FHA domain-containing protein